MLKYYCLLLTVPSTLYLKCRCVSCLPCYFSVVSGWCYMRKVEYWSWPMAEHILSQWETNLSLWYNSLIVRLILVFFIPGEFLSPVALARWPLLKHILDKEKCFENPLQELPLLEKDHRFDEMSIFWSLFNVEGLETLALIWSCARNWWLHFLIPSSFLTVLTGIIRTIPISVLLQKT